MTDISPPTTTAATQVDSPAGDALAPADLSGHLRLLGGRDATAHLLAAVEVGAVRLFMVKIEAGSCSAARGR
jgi:hypothetical protein